jgi:hypothetical protein
MPRSKPVTDQVLTTSVGGGAISPSSLYILHSSARLEEVVPMLLEGEFPDDRRRGSSVARLGVRRWARLSAPGFPALVRERLCVGPGGRLCRPFTARGEPCRAVWSASRWVAIKMPTEARSLSYRWGRAVAFVNGKRVTVQYGHIGKELQTSPSWRHDNRMDPLDEWRISAGPILRRPDHGKTA